MYELTDDEAYTLTELAAEITRQSGKKVTYQNLSEADFKMALLSVVRALYILLNNFCSVCWERSDLDLPGFLNLEGQGTGSPFPSADKGLSE